MGISLGSTGKNCREVLYALNLLVQITVAFVLC